MTTPTSRMGFFSRRGNTDVKKTASTPNGQCTHHAETFLTKFVMVLSATVFPAFSSHWDRWLRLLSIQFNFHIHTAKGLRSGWRSVFVSLEGLDEKVAMTRNRHKRNSVGIRGDNSFHTNQWSFEALSIGNLHVYTGKRSKRNLKIVTDTQKSNIHASNFSKISHLYNKNNFLPVLSVWQCKMEEPTSIKHSVEWKIQESTYNFATSGNRQKHRTNLCF